MILQAIDAFAKAKSDDEKAKVWLEKVVELTKEDEPEDAYLRGKGLQKLGIVSYRNGDEGDAEGRFKEVRSASRASHKEGHLTPLTHLT